MQKWLNGLNERQREAVTATEGPLLIVAGAGAGKTKTLVHRIGHLVEERGVRQEEILAITFTNKAAREMRERVATLLGGVTARYSTPWRRTVGAPWIGTFHGLGVYLLRERGESIGVPKTFHILDREDALSLLKRAMRTEGIDTKQFEPSRMLSLVSRVKSSGDPEEKLESISHNRYLVETLSRIYREYEHLLHESHGLDFDDLLLLSVRLLRESREALEYFHTQWTYIHVDEYQDTNEIQYELVRLLSQKHHNLCVVGDSDQNIYSWRGATIENILSFEEDYPDARVVLLEENYRSSKLILEVANAVIEKNTMRKPKRLFTNNDTGEPISLFEAYDENDEARFVGETVRSLVGGAVRPEEIAILYRTNFQSRVLEEALLYRDIPYQVLGTRFFERKEVKDLVAYLRAAMDPSSFLDIVRSINTPTRGIGKVTVERVLTGKRGELPATAKKKVGEYFFLLSRIHAYAGEHSVSETVRFAMKESGLADFYARGDDDERERLLNMEELVTLAMRYDHIGGKEGVTQLLSDAALEGDQDEIDRGVKEGVRLMTVHAAKGLEFPYVFITGLEQDLFPSRRSQDESKDLSEREEERRLFYVAITRAAKKVYLSYASFRTIFGNRLVNVPSEFLNDIPGHVLRYEERPRADLLSNEGEGVIYV